MTFGLSGAALGALAVGGATLASGALQSSAAKSAAKTQAGAAEAGIEEQRRQFDAIQELLKPYVQAGQGAITGFQPFQQAGMQAFEQQQALAGFPLPHPPALAFAATRRPPPLSNLGIDFPGPAGSVPVVSAWEVLRQPPEFWRDRIVVFGRTPSRLADRRPSPFGALSSVELQAAALATVLEGRGFRPLPLPGTVALLLGWGTLALVLLARSAQAAGTAATALALASVGLGAASLAWLAGWWLPVTGLVAAPLLGGGGRACGHRHPIIRWRRGPHQRPASRSPPPHTHTHAARPG